MSKQTFDAVMAGAEAPYRNAVITNTWGHLFPTGLYYEGYVRIATSIYQSDHGIIDEAIAVSSSPWWFDAITDFAFNAQEDMEDGEVAHFNIAVTIQSCIEEEPYYWTEEDGEWLEEAPRYQKINIVQQEKTIIIKPI